MKGEVPLKGRQVRGGSPGQKERRGGCRALGRLRLGRTGVGLPYPRPPLSLIWDPRLGAHLAFEPPRRLQLFLESLLHAGAGAGLSPPPPARRPVHTHGRHTARSRGPPQDEHASPEQKPGGNPCERLQAPSLAGAAPRSPARPAAMGTVSWEAPGGTRRDPRPSLSQSLDSAACDA